LLFLGAACDDSAPPETTTSREEDEPETGPSELQEDEVAPNAGAIEVEQTKLIFMPDQTGGKFHNLLVLVRNTSEQVAIDVSGQVSITENGRLVHSLNPIPVNILPGEEGLFQELVELPKAVMDGKIETSISVSRFVETRPIDSPVSFRRLGYVHDEFGGCKITGVVENRFTEQKSDLQLRIAGFRGTKLVTGGFTYVDQVFPKQEATFEMTAFSPAECPEDLDEIRVLPNLGEDKIFNP
jgi:hypothetical protein